MIRRARARGTGSLSARLRVGRFMGAASERTPMEMNMRAPNVALFVISGCLAVLGVLCALPIEMPLPGLNANNAAWYIFLGWFMLAAGCVLRPERSSEQVQSPAS
jgi:hypothetical protein